MNELSHRPDRTGRVLDRILPLAGVCFAVLEAAGDLTIGEFPDGNTSASELTTYYSAHHGAVSLGGTLMALGGLFLALFGVSVWARLRETRASAIVGGIVLVGTAVAAVGEIDAGATYAMLGHIGGDRTVDPAALQALHITSGAGSGVGTLLLLLGIFGAGLTRVVPVWLGVVGIVLGVAMMTAFGFVASLLFLPWIAVAGIVMAVRPPRTRAAVADPDAVRAAA